MQLVTAFGAIQAQEYEHAKWAVGLRSPGTTAADIEGALAAGAILRSHPMRGTHHFVAREDLRWLMALMGPLMIKRAARRYRELGLDEKTLTKAMSAITRALAGGQHLARAETAEVLRRAKIATDGQRLPHIIYRAELESLVCSGTRKGKQITIALFDERVPSGKQRSREDSLRDLATRYFATRGPATLADFIWWCQLPAADARAAIELAGAVASDGYYALGSVPSGKAPRALLLPPYDEYAVAYRDRSALGTPPKKPKNFGESTLLGPLVVVDGKVVGSWRRAITKRSLDVTVTPWTKLSRVDAAAVKAAVERYRAFYAPPSE